jgi:hypothetical protein
VIIMKEALLQFALPRVVAALIDVEHIPKFARQAGVRDLRFEYSTVGHAVYVTCSRELAASLLVSLQRRMRGATLPIEYLTEYMDAVARVQRALDIEL